MNQDSASQSLRRPIKLGELRTRFLAALVLAGVALWASYLGGWPASVLAIVASLAVAVEWLQVTGRAKLTFPPIALVVSTILAVALAGAVSLSSSLALMLGAGAILGIATRDPWLGAGVPYAAALGVGTLALRGEAEFGWPALVFLFAIVWVTDSAAYFGGSLIGGPKLWPAVSPKKTWAGAIAGLIGAALAGAAAAALLGIPLTGSLLAASFGLSLVAQAGDLLESAIKRHFGVKDAGRLIPGHGGVMDRVDGLSLAGVVGAAIGFLHAGPEHIGRGLLLW